jgi:hypothetical protein
LVAGTVYTNAQPNITSVGTLTALSVTGNISSGNASLGNAASATYFIGDGSLLTNLSIASASVANANYAAYAGNITTAAQPNITSTGTLVNLAVSGNVAFSGANVTLGTVANLHVAGGTADYVLKTDGSGNLSWVAQTPSAVVTVDNFTGNGVATAYTLSVTPSSVNNVLVNINGATQLREAYSVSGTTLTFSSAPPNTSKIEITTFGLTAGGAGGGGASALNDLTDVTITTPSTNQVVKYNGSSWVNATIPGVSYIDVVANYSLAAGTKYIVNTSSANLTLTLPSSGTLGDEISILDGTGNASTHAITVARNGGNIQGLASDMTVSTDRAAFTLVYYNSTQGWILTNV